MSDMSPHGVPELGPSFGELTLPAGVPRTRGTRVSVPLDDLRLALVTELFDLAGAGREFADGGDRAAAVQSLNRAAWLGAWERTVEQVAQRLSESFNRRLEAAARESRLPAKRVAELSMDREETSSLAARLGSGAGDFVAALDELERTVPRAAARPEAWPVWQEALLSTARRLESAWLTLEAEAADEDRRWAREVERVRRWRRPTWQLWLATLAVVALAAWIGLVFGRMVPAPPFLSDAVAGWWGTP